MTRKLIVGLIIMSIAGGIVAKVAFWLLREQSVITVQNEQAAPCLPSDEDVSELEVEIIWPRLRFRATPELGRELLEEFRQARRVVIRRGYDVKVAKLGKVRIILGDSERVVVDLVTPDGEKSWLGIGDNGYQAQISRSEMEEILQRMYSATTKEKDAEGR